MNTLQLLIICATIVGALAIICYTTAYLATNPTIIKTIKETCRENLN